METPRRIYVPSADKWALLKGHLNSTKASKMATYILRMQKHYQLSAFQFHPKLKLSRTFWVCVSGFKSSATPHASAANATYILKMRRHCQLASSTSQRWLERSRTSCGCASIVKQSVQLHTCVRDDYVHSEGAQALSNIELSAQLHLGITTATYPLRMSMVIVKSSARLLPNVKNRHVLPAEDAGIVSSAWRQYPERSLTLWECASGNVK